MLAQQQWPRLLGRFMDRANLWLPPIWDQLFPAEQARIVRLLVERVEIRAGGADIRLRVAGLTSFVRDLGGRPDTSALAAA
jgi:hypothetical protein